MKPRALICMNRPKPSAQSDSEAADPLGKHFSEPAESVEPAWRHQFPICDPLYFCSWFSVRGLTFDEQHCESTESLESVESVESIEWIGIQRCGRPVRHECCYTRFASWCTSWSPFPSRPSGPSRSSSASAPGPSRPSGHNGHNGHNRQHLGAPAA